jgi:hypothetical protein
MYVRYYVGLGSSERIILNKPTTMYAYRRGLTELLQVQWEGTGLVNLGNGTKYTFPGLLNFGTWMDYMLFPLIPLLLLLDLSNFQT